MQVDRYAVDVYNAVDFMDILVDDEGMDTEEACRIAAGRYQVNPEEVQEAYNGTY